MDEEISIIDTKTRNEKIKNFFLVNKKKLISLFTIIIIIFLGFYTYQIHKDNQKNQLSDKYNRAIISFESGEKDKIISSMKEIIYNKDSTYSPLALYFLIDNRLIENQSEVNELFDVIIKKTSLENEIKNLVIYKKALYNADIVNENQLISILKPITSSESVWKSHALYLLAEYFYSKEEMQKSKEFFEQIIITENASKDIVIQAQKRLNRDLSE